MKTTKLLLSCLALVLLILPAAACQEQVQLPKKDPLQGIIELVVANNPILQSQKDLIEEIQKMPEPGASFRMP